MKRSLITAMLFACSTQAHAASWKGLWQATTAALIAGNAADAMSSYHKQEANPLLGRGTFGGRQLGIKIGISGAVVVFEAIAIRKAPRSAKPLAIVNVAAGATFGVVAVHNSTISR